MFTLVALDGPRAGQVARGTLALVPTDTVHRLYDTRFGAPRRRRDERPLRGWAELRGEVGLETAGTPLDSRDPALPGVVSILDSAQSRLTLRLGDRLMFDGGFNELTVTEAGDDGFVGQWRYPPWRVRSTGSIVDAEVARFPPWEGPAEKRRRR